MSISRDRGHSAFSAWRKKQSVPNQQSGIAVVLVLVFLLVIAAAVALKGGEELGEIHVAAADAEVRRIDYAAQAGLQHALWRAGNSACAGDFTIPPTAIGPDKYSASTTGGGTGTAYVLPADQDAWIRSDDTDQNNGTDATNHVKFDGGKVEQVLTRFDLSTLPANAQVNSAVAWFHLKSGKNHAEGPITVHRVTVDWGETTVTWDSFGGWYETSQIGVIPAQDVGDVWVPVNITGQVQAWVNGQPNYGILFDSTAEKLHTEYTAREDATNPPRLEVVVGTGPPSPLDIQATGTLANGKTRTLTRPVTRALQPTSILTLRPDPTDGIDAYIWEKNKTTNYGTDDETWVARGTNNTALALFRFRTGGVPPGAKILGATLSLHHESGNDSNVPVTAHRITNPWDEDFVTWNRRDNGTNWDTAGGDLDATVIAETDVGPVKDIRYEWDITALVQGWAQGSYPNYGVALATALDGAFGERFFTSDKDEPAKSPSLTIDYACECGTTCMAPQGAGNVLMVVDDAASPGAGDREIQSFLEVWGYTVTMISDQRSQGSFDAGFAANDVVFVSESVNAGTLGTKVSAAPIGVVNAEGNLNDELGISSGRGTPVGDTLDVVDSTHYITAVFPATPLQFKTVATELASISGTVSPDALVLAETGGAGGLVVLEAGAAAAGGGTVSSRRALVPVGDANVSWSYMTNNGQLLVQRAIAWAMGSDKVTIGDLLLVVHDPGNLRSQEEAKKALMESWGFAVNLIDEDDAQADYDAAIANNDVAYIPQDIDDSKLANKLTNASIGVVNEEGEQVDELGFAQDKLFKSRDEIDVIDTSHYITQPFAMGLLTFVDSNQSVHMLNGSIAPGLQTLGESFNVGSQWKRSLATLDAGDDLWGGGTAAGRRVQLPWGGGTFDINQLNDDGRTIMRRALEWGAGATTPVTPIAHWPLDEGSGPAAVDIVGGNDATLNGGTTWTTGTLGGALDFDGSGDTTSTDSNFTPPPVGTVMFWMRVSGSPASHGRILGLDDTWEVRHVTTGTPDGIPYGLVFDLGVSGVNTEFVTTTTVDVPNRWYHIAAAYDTTTDAYAVYIDGVPHKSGTYPSSLTVPGDNVLSFGTRTGSSNYFDGTLDDIRVYDRFLSAAEIADIAADGGGSGPVAHWKLDETSGTNAADSAGGNDGTLVNGPAWTPGTIDGGLDFDGSNDRVDAGTFDVSGSGLSLMGWFNADALPATNDPRIVSKASSTAEADAWWQLSILTSGSNANIRLRTKAGGTTSTLIDSSTNLNTGQWYFAVGTYDAATGEMKLYLDGTEVANRAHAVGGAVDTNATVPVAIGANGSAEQFFDGVLDDVRVYDKVLSASEISDLYATGGGGGGPTTTFEVRVTTGSDDAEESVSTGNVNLTSSDLELISDGSNAQLVGMRFTNVTVPNGATVANAYVQFQVDETNSGATNVNVQGHAIDDAPTFTSSNSNISSRSRTTATVPWAPVPWTTVGEAGPDQQTPNIAAVIQEIVDRPGWASGNDIVIIITGSGERTAESYNGVSAAAPLLHIEYN